jgi:glycosyltransferase involved in cell wall biosynthesis
MLMQICYVYYHDPRFVPIHAYEIINELLLRGHEVHVFTFIDEDIARAQLPTGRLSVHNLRIVRARFISELLFIAVLCPYLLLWSLVHRPDAIYTRHSATSLAATLVAALLRKPCLIEINDIALDKLKFSRASQIKVGWIRLYCYINAHLASSLLPVTKQIATWLRQHYRVPARKVVVLPNGVNAERFRPERRTKARLRYKIPLDTRVILSLGSLFPWAGIETLIAAAPRILERFPDTLFVIGSGEEPYCSRLKKRVARCGLKRSFRFFDFIPWDEASWFISMADICVAPFVFKEIRSGICSLRVLSYLACGRPVVGSDISGLGDMLENNGVGRSFHMGNHDDLSGALLALLTDQTRAAEMGRRGRAFVAECCSWPVIVDRLEALCFQLAAGEGR